MIDFRFMTVRVIYFFGLLLTVFALGCEQKTEPATAPAVEDYLKNLISIMKNNSINRKTIDWNVFTGNVLEKAKGSQNIDDPRISAAIQAALTQLNDDHSYFMNNKGSYLIGSGRPPCKNATPILPNVGNDIGYIKIEAFSGQGTAATTQAETIVNRIKLADGPSIRGWIVDLRGNTGGNMWPMLSGVEPILGEGAWGYFIDPDNNIDAWDKKFSAYIKVNYPYTLQKPNPKVAVLTDEATASSGEAIAVAFKGRPNTKSFGRPTCGVSSAVKGYSFLDGSMLGLTVSVMADRNKTMYGKAVEPDVNETNQEVYLQKALDWLRQ
jgi:C-terminal processing protease CtpA/Prc